MKKLVLSLFFICVTLGNLAKADVATGSVAENYNGSWFGGCIGCAAQAKDASALAAWKNDGKATYASIKAQKAARVAAKAKGTGNYEAIIATAFWPSDIMWGYNNAALKLIDAGDAKRKVDPAASNEDYTQAKSLLVSATEVLKSAAVTQGLVPFSYNEELKAEVLADKHLGMKFVDAQLKAQKVAFGVESANLSKADKTVSKNLTYVKRCLGELPWPKATKVTQGIDSED